jgi:hypothetical protein
MTQKCVWVLEIGVLAAAKDRIASWDIWEAYTTKREAQDELRRDFKNRASWVTAKFHKATNRIRKYVPERAA